LFRPGAKLCLKPHTELRRRAVQALK
jgi:hypothetical protein